MISCLQQVWETHNQPPCDVYSSSMDILHCAFTSCLVACLKLMVSCALSRRSHSTVSTQIYNSVYSVAYSFFARGSFSPAVFLLHSDRAGCYGVSNVEQEGQRVNVVCFIWNAAQEGIASIKVCSLTQEAFTVHVVAAMVSACYTCPPPPTHTPCLPPTQPLQWHVGLAYAGHEVCSSCGQLVPSH